LQGETGKPLMEQDYGRVFISAIDQEELSLAPVYSKYCANLALSDRARKGFLSNRPEFVQFLDESLNKAGIEKQQLKSFLIKPLQRLCKYPLLLKELVKHFIGPATSPVLVSLNEALERVNQLVRYNYRASSSGAYRCFD